MLTISAEDRISAMERESGAIRREALAPEHAHIRRRWLFTRILSMLLLSSVVGCGAQPVPLSAYPDGVWLHGTGSRAPSTAMPDMEWPPARPTTTFEVGSFGDANEPKKLGDAFLKVKSMLTTADLLESHVLGIGDNGFAVLTRMESITDDGSPRSDPGRFAFDDAGRIQGKFSVTSYIDALLNRKPGRFRMFIMTVTPRVVAPDAAVQRDWSQALTQYSQGAAHLPKSLADTVASAGTHITILIYEFRRAAPDDEKPSVVKSSSLTAKQHIVGAGLMKREDFEK